MTCLAVNCNLSKLASARQNHDEFIRAYRATRFKGFEDPGDVMRLPHGVFHATYRVKEIRASAVSEERSLTGRRLFGVTVEYEASNGHA